MIILASQVQKVVPKIVPTLPLFVDYNHLLDLNENVEADAIRVSTDDNFHGISYQRVETQKCLNEYEENGIGESEKRTRGIKKKRMGKKL